MTEYPNCDEFYIKAHPQNNSTMCTASCFHIISEMLSRMYSIGGYKIPVGRLNRIFGYSGVSGGVSVKNIYSSFSRNYRGPLEIIEIQDDYNGNKINMLKKEYIDKCITYPIVNIDLVEVATLVNEGHLEWNVSFRYAYSLTSSTRTEYHAMILLNVNKSKNMVYLYDPLDISIPQKEKISYKENLEMAQQVDLNIFYKIWKYLPYEKVNILPEDKRKELIVRLAWVLVPKKMSKIISKRRGETIQQKITSERWS